MSLPGTMFAAQRRAGAVDRLKLAVVGVAGQGNYNLTNVAHEEIVALCDVDADRAAEARKRFPRASFYQDYRRMLDQQKDIQAVVISTPDHHHAFAAIQAMRAGKHVYCEKPLAHSVHEVRAMMDAAARQNLVTQMGTQIHAGENYRRVVEIIQAGVLGQVRRVHVWCSPRDMAGIRVPAGKVPANLDYELWIGPAPYRAYPPYRHGNTTRLNFDWRWWWDFGGGLLADMACHYMDLPHWALNLRTPSTISARGRVTYKGDNDVPDLLQVDYEYPARGSLPAVHLTWYHGVSGPDLDGKVTYRTGSAIGRDGKPQAHAFSSGVLFEGEKGNLLADYNFLQLLPEERFRDFELPRPTIIRSIGHHREWLNAIRNGGNTTCNFDYSGALSETVLLGNVAYRSGARLQYDAKSGRITNNERANEYLRREYRKGWTL
jgi:predicted dehydrogenase